MATAQRGERMSDRIDRRRLIIPALGSIYEAGAPYSYALMRFATGAILFPHGYQKVFYSSPDRLAVAIGNKGLPLALTLAYLTFFSEFVAAACLAVGLFTRIAATMIFVEMIVIAIVIPGALRILLDQSGVRIPAAVGRFLPRHLFSGRGTMVGRSLHRQGILDGVAKLDRLGQLIARSRMMVLSPTARPARDQRAPTQASRRRISSRIFSRNSSLRAGRSFSGILNRSKTLNFSRMG
jgi:putative oxidoreductase